MRGGSIGPNHRDAMSVIALPSHFARHVSDVGDKSGAISERRLLRTSIRQ